MSLAPGVRRSLVGKSSVLVVVAQFTSLDITISLSIMLYCADQKRWTADGPEPQPKVHRLPGGDCLNLQLDP
jgi:hypothetical protein